MILVVAATEREIEPVAEVLSSVPETCCLVAGIGCMETALNLTRFLSSSLDNVHTVINTGVGGAYVGAGVNMMDVCLAERERLADLGICLSGEIVEFEGLGIKVDFMMDQELLSQAQAVLSDDFIVHSGGFVSVNCVSATSIRGEFLRTRHQAICENMEGAAVARVCQEFKLPCLELRCISNMVEDRDPSKWRLDEAIANGAEATLAVVRALI